MILILLLIAFFVWAIYSLCCQISNPTPPQNEKEKFINNVYKESSVSMPRGKGSCSTSNNVIQINANSDTSSPPVSEFQSRLLNCLQAVEENNCEEPTPEIMAEIMSEIDRIKEDLLDSAKKGDYTIDSSGRKIVSAISDHLTYSFSKISCFNPMKEYNRWEANATMGMSPGRRRQFCRNNYAAFTRALNETGVISVSIKEDCVDTLEIYRKILSEKLIPDGIFLQPIIYLKKEKTEHPIPAIFHESPHKYKEYFLNAGIAFKYSCVL